MRNRQPYFAANNKRKVSTMRNKGLAPVNIDLSKFKPVKIVNIAMDANGKTLVTVNVPMDPLEIAFIASQAVTANIAQAQQTNSLLINPNRESQSQSQAPAATQAQSESPESIGVVGG